MCLAIDIYVWQRGFHALSCEVVRKGHFWQLLLSSFEKDVSHT